jgi:DNA-binding GntR family transcriptional regulator
MPVVGGRVRQGRTLVEDVYRGVRSKILFGQLEPGQRLHLADLASEYGVSLGVVREGVTRLASEELVEATPQQGFRVRRLSVDDLLDITWVRVQLETMALRASIANGDLAWEASLVGAHYSLAATPVHHPDGTLNTNWMTAHSAYHAALAAACGSPLLIRLRQQLFDASEIYRYWNDRVRPNAARDVPREHKAILDAALARDADRAVKIVTSHLEETARHLIACGPAQLEPGTATSRSRQRATAEHPTRRAAPRRSRSAAAAAD